MKNLAQTFLTQKEQDTLVQCVKGVEKQTSGEIVPVIASASYEYPRSTIIGALVYGIVAAICTALLFNQTGMWAYLVQLLGFFFVFTRLLDAFPAMKRPFIAKDEMREEINEAAFTAFYQNGLHRTRDLTGIIIYVSVFERGVQVLADQGINDKVDPKVWEEVVALITEGIKAGRPGEALCQGVTRCGELVSKHFPIKADDTDELPNLIIEGKTR
ncbi:TPM domain-containing protein [uncultured Pseudodesulfovibrio sp.]|uniref:TPM domain-containing protein n=1 Tax=uncultured Pseudodesulfovibrio sp. TaxID=2035858 RepID=UPI0029C9B051|nr:TPM domain-containing protein [uncultured Pseudodesulfovibrio sp.]